VCRGGGRWCVGGTKCGVVVWCSRWVVVVVVVGAGGVGKNISFILLFTIVIAISHMSIVHCCHFILQNRTAGHAANCFSSGLLQ